MSKIGNRKNQHHATVKRFGDRRIYAKCSCGSHLMAGVNVGKRAVFGFTLAGTMCPALDLARRRLKIA